MTNADKFKSLFGIYATELWAMPEKDFLKWLNSEVSNSSEFPNGWIPCTKKKHPDKSMYCHVTVIDDDGDYIADNDDWDVDSESWDEYSDDEIIAWMPEITPYQPEEEEYGAY